MEPKRVRVKYDYVIYHKEIGKGRFTLTAEEYPEDCDYFVLTFEEVE